ncbi:hypothetical protein [Ruminococcus flavefaciens]|uniref:hypothetical protein n=1 Tax=Ruminococcus flavefaciens TaxID=1265 RepID=UPI0013DBEA59|nr:hypothetical protein [Ruminococcus flavefaciens]
MKKNEYKKDQEKKVLFNFIKANLVDNLLKDKAEIEHRSKSSVAEQLILDSLLPENSIARDIVSTYLYNDDNPIGNTLSAIFSYNAAGVNWKSVNDNLIPLVQFAKKQLVYCSTPLSGDEPELYHCISQIETIIDMLLALAEEKPEMKSNILHEAEYTRVLLKDLQERPNHVKLFNFYQILLNNWEYFKTSTITYRLLMDLTLLEKGWRNYAEIRMELLQIINDVSKEWN